MNSNEIVRYLGKPSSAFSRNDLVKFIMDNNYEMINFRFVGGDGRLKTLNFIISSREELERILSAGERVDGSSIFPYVGAASSDLYVIPRYGTAYVNPFSSIPAVDLLCTYYTNEGEPFWGSPGNILAKAHTVFKEKTGLSIEAMAELEFYIISEKVDLYPNPTQKGYSGSTPFIKWEKLRCEAMKLITQAGGRIRYGHSEVGYVSLDDVDIEQHEIEFSLGPIEDAADQIVLAKWILRSLAYRYGVTVSFVPKIIMDLAGNGLHIHTKLMREDQNIMLRGDELSAEAKKVIAGLLSLAPSLCAFGNTVPVSYMRMVPNQEAPTNVCWGDRNRSVLVRLPLSGKNVHEMVRKANPGDRGGIPCVKHRQTIEFRAPDGSANIHLLLAGMAVAARIGLEMNDALELAENLYIEENIFSKSFGEKRKNLPQLPGSCKESADRILENREEYQRHGVFPSYMLDAVAQSLMDFGDEELSRRIRDDKDTLREIANRFLHCS